MQRDNWRLRIRRTKSPDEIAKTLTALSAICSYAMLHIQCIFMELQIYVYLLNYSKKIYIVNIMITLSRLLAGKTVRFFAPPYS